MYKYLDTIKSPSDLKRLSLSQVSILCEEIRDFIINSISKSGGHLAGNLGVVELTVALHRVLDAPKDKIVWDVGHQSYVHKIITGRADKLSTIRHIDGLCGFCNPTESEYDVSYTGHASASLSTAAGLAEARKISRENYNVAAVIGDGAFTGGLAFEALNNIGNLKSKMLIILNDNEMSIAENVGAFSTLLSRARTNKSYTDSKRKLLERIKKMPNGGEKLLRILHKIKKHIKSALTPNLLFEQFGITYLGPVNGHNIEDMEDIFRRALELDEPVLVHVITKKGKGYAPAEKSPSIFHGVGPFEKDTGKIRTCEETYSDVFGKKLISLAEKNEKVIAITPAMLLGSGLKTFAEKFPDRIYDVGIAEGYAVTFAGGMAIGGSVPIVSVYSSFLQRAYDNIIHDVALGNHHVVFAVDRAGLVAGDGATHQGIFDISYLTAIPNMVLLSPSSFKELERMLEYAVNIHTGPIALRYPKGNQISELDNGDFVPGKASVIKEGSDVTIVAEGQCVGIALEATALLLGKGINSEIIDIRTIKPLDYDTIFKSANKTSKLFVLEENLIRGGIGEMISTEAKLRNLGFAIQLKAIDDKFVTHGSIDEISRYYGFTPNQIANDIERML